MILGGDSRSESSWNISQIDLMLLAFNKVRRSRWLPRVHGRGKVHGHSAQIPTAQRDKSPQGLYIKD